MGLLFLQRPKLQRPQLVHMKVIQLGRSGPRLMLSRQTFIIIIIWSLMVILSTMIIMTILYIMDISHQFLPLIIWIPFTLTSQTFTILLTLFLSHIMRSIIISVFIMPNLNHPHCTIYPLCIFLPLKLIIKKLQNFLILLHYNIITTSVTQRPCTKPPSPATLIPLQSMEPPHLLLLVVYPTLQPSFGIPPRPLLLWHTPMGMQYLLSRMHIVLPFIQRLIFQVIYLLKLFLSLSLDILLHLSHQ